MGKKSIEPSINEEARFLLECISDKAGKPFDPIHLVNNAVSNIICKISFGYRFEYSDPRFAYLLELLRARLAAIGASSLVSMFPFLAHTPLFHTMHRSIKEQEHFIQDIVKEHRSSYDHNDVRDIMDMHVGESDHWDSLTKDGGQFQKDSFSDRTLTQTITTLFAAGSDTTTNTLLWLLLFMALHPGIQSTVQSEIDDVVGKSRQPLLADRKVMPFTNAVILELHRIRPIVPLAVPHQTKDETTLDGYIIPKDTVVLVNIYALHHDPDTFPEPEKFDPTRFLSADRKTVIRHESLIPFGIGRRVCLGENLAKDETFLYFVNLLQQFTFKFPDGKPATSLKGLPGIVLSTGPFEICAVRRN